MKEISDGSLIPGENLTPLNKFDKDEWKSICKDAQKQLSDTMLKSRGKSSFVSNDLNNSIEGKNVSI